MKKLYSQMSRAELEIEMVQSLEAAAQAEFPSQIELYQRKYFMAKAYTLDPADFPPGLYHVERVQNEQFELTYVNGIMGWGKLGSDPEASFPISMLTSVN
jgi:hypothetical protein